MWIRSARLNLVISTFLCRADATFMRVLGLLSPTNPAANTTLGNLKTIFCLDILVQVTVRLRPPNVRHSRANHTRRHSYGAVRETSSSLNKIVQQFSAS